MKEQRIWLGFAKGDATPYRVYSTAEEAIEDRKARHKPERLDIVEGVFVPTNKLPEFK